MREQNFSEWLCQEVTTKRIALIALFENRDRLLYVESPSIRKKYMDLIGVYEIPVLEKELEVSLLNRKAELIQIAINRREPIDLSQIEEKLEQEKAMQLSRVESEDLTLEELPTLTEKEQNDLQLYYRDITRVCHPAVNKDITDVQKELYMKAVEAYKMQNLEEMKIIYDMLFPPKGMQEISEISDLIDMVHVEDDAKSEYRKFAATLATDYLLAKELYQSFCPLEEDYVVLNYINAFNVQCKTIEDEIIRIMSSFPFNAVSTMNDPEKVREYLSELSIRERNCEKEKSELESSIKKFLEGHTNI